MSGTLSVIASSGHAGTMWLTNVLDAGTDTVWRHHFRETVTGRQWDSLDGKHPNHRVFTQYWAAIRQELSSGDFGDGNSWPPNLLHDVNERQPINKVIYLIRDGVQQLNSLATTSMALNRWPPAAQRRFEEYYYLAPTLWEKGESEFTHWDRLCLLVAANYFMPQHLRDKGLVVDVYSLETLTTDVEALAKLAPKLSEEELTGWQEKDMNRKVQGGRARTTIWRKWSSEQRESYKNIVGRFEDEIT